MCKVSTGYARDKINGPMFFTNGHRPFQDFGSLVGQARAVVPTEVGWVDGKRVGFGVGDLGNMAGHSSDTACQNGLECLLMACASRTAKTRGQVPTQLSVDRSS